MSLILPVGTDAAGTLSLGDFRAAGVFLTAGRRQDNTIGGIGQARRCNTIAHNGGPGVIVGTSVSDSTTVGDAVLGNAIYANGGATGLGIDLADDGVDVSANGPGGSARSGPNDLQNYPVFTRATASIANNRASATISFSSLASATFRLEFFLNSVTDLSPQGRTFLGAVQVTTDANGNLLTATPLTTGVLLGTVNTGNNTVSVTLPVAPGTLMDSLTATATVLTVGSGQNGTVGDSSEFSAAALIGP